MSSSYMDQPLGRFLDAVASREPAPGGGAVAATALAMSAGLTGMAARFSEGRLEGAAERAARADRLRERAAPLAQRDADAYGQVVAAYRLPRDPDPQARRDRIREALRTAADVPTEIAEIAEEVAGEASNLAREGNPNLNGDAVTAVLMAQAAAQSAARLVRLNVDAGDIDDEPARRAQRCVREIADHVRTVTCGEDGGDPM